MREELELVGGREDEYLVNMQHTVIPSWYQREGYVQAMANLIEKEVYKFENPEEVCFDIALYFILDSFLWFGSFQVSSL
jgi:hypothetical protein